MKETHLFIFFFFPPYVYVFIYLIYFQLRRVSVAARRVFVEVCGLLIAVASLVAEHGL